MKVLLIGYGSIGKRHEDVLLGCNQVSKIDIVTKQKLTGKKTFFTLKDIDNLNYYDYFIIASETNKHYEQLLYLELNLLNKIIFCEKPLFEKKRNLEIKNNRVFVGYVLRFHPLLEKLKELIEKEKVLYVNVYCGQYLPSWRPDSDYRKSYSSKKEEGGGVLLDLSHELDYIQWLFSKIIEIKSYQLKVSDLEINSDDLVTFIGKTEKNIIVNLTIDYISKIDYRKIILHSNEYTYELDFIKNSLIVKDKERKEEHFTSKDLDRNYMFKKMHETILNKQENICSYKEASLVMNTISYIQEESNE